MEDFLRLSSAYFYELAQFRFTVFNPVFWFCFLVLFVSFIYSWGVSKSFSFSFMVGGILVLTTKMEDLAKGAFEKGGEVFDPIGIRLLAVCAIALVAMYYFFIKSD